MVDSVVEVLHGSDAEHARKKSSNNSSNQQRNRAYTNICIYYTHINILATKLLQEQMAIN